MLAAPLLVPCVLVGVKLGAPAALRAPFDAFVQECALLASTAGFACAETMTANRAAPDPATFIGSGKVEELRVSCEAHKAQVVVFVNALSPIQQRNLERALMLPVVDRTALILDIFAQRAQSHEGKLQVQLAKAQYQVTRLVRQWSHLERQRGGIGVRAGPGERQLELDKRMLREQIKSIKARLEKVQKQRETQRRSRLRSGTLRIAIVGYTNAGKSTLFAALTNSKVYVADQLFATLDPTTRRIKLSASTSLAISDTVGFVRELPHMLVAAFKSTLQEAMDADLLLHVVDASNLLLDEQVEAVQTVLAEIGADDIPQWLVHNKIDLSGHRAGYVEHAQASPSEHEPMQGSTAIQHHFYLSAHSGEGVNVLREALLEAAQTHAASMRRPEVSQSDMRVT